MQLKPVVTQITTPGVLPSAFKFWSACWLKKQKENATLKPAHINTPDRFQSPPYQYT